MKKLFLSLAIIIFLLPVCSFGQNVGIGTKTPLARLHVTDSCVLFSASGAAPATSNSTPIEGAGRRMMWYPDKAAFRVGYVDGLQWAYDNLGKYSVAMGYNTIAADYSTAIGDGCQALNNYATAIGVGTIASGGYSTAMGQGTTASGDYATAMGAATKASGAYSTASGVNTIAAGTFSFAAGYQAYAYGSASFAMGYNATANADFSTALGRSTTAGGYNSFVWGENSNTTGSNSIVLGENLFDGGHKGNAMLGDTDPWNAGSVGSGSDDQMICRFNNGYYFITGGNTNRTGLIAVHGDNSWSAISDSTKKEKIVAVNGEDVLQKIAQFKLSTWNYKGQDPKVFRHYGPMAQDFHNAFGKDLIGNIGCDTLINQQDFLGVSFIAIQALEKRTEKIETLQKQNTAQQQQINELQQNNMALQQQMQTLLNTVATLNKQVQSLAIKTIDSRSIIANK